MAETLTWLATAATIIAALMTASNLGARITGYGFCVFLIGSLAWLASGIMSGQPALSWTNAVLTVLNIFGIWRWLGREAQVEKGGKRAAKASERGAQESLFPVSLLTAAPLTSDGTKLGSCVDAMASCEDGRLRYVLVSEGGVAGVGETLRRIEWSDVEVADGQAHTTIDPGQFANLETVERDAWPAR